MACNKAFYILVFALSFSILLTVTVPPTPALAQSITLSPVSGFLGTEIIVTGTGFDTAESSYVYLYFDEHRIVSVRVSETGTFTIDFSVPYYVSPGRSYKITIQDEDGTILAGEWFIVGAKIDLYPYRGKIKGRIEIGGRYFDADKEVGLYFSSDKANIGDSIDYEVTAYEYIGEVETNADGDFETLHSFSIPDELTDGKDREDVHSGDYYIYAAHFPGEKRIKAAANFVVIGGEIEVHPTSGIQDTEVRVTGTDFYSGDNGYVYLYFGRYRIKSIEVSETGTFTTDFAVPYYIRPGRSYKITVQDEGGVTLAEAENQFIVGAKIDLYIDDSYSDRGKIDEWIEIGGRYFDANKKVRLYFSSDKADIDKRIDWHVTAYEYIGEVETNADGDFKTLYSFSIPSELTDGEDEEDVLSGDYYIYAIYLTGDKRIKAAAKFLVLGIKLNPEEGTVSSEVEISGEDLEENQKITVEYDEDELEIAGGDGETNSEGRFTCSIIIPESVAGDHVIGISSETGNKYEAVFSVKSRIIIIPTEAAVGDEVKVSGTGFEAPYYSSDYITIILDGDEVLTKPALIQTNPSGSFNVSFIVPFDSSRAGDSTIKVEAYDESFNMAEAQLTILATPVISTPPATQADMTLYPSTSQTSPGHVGMELTISGTGFIANAMVSVTYSNGEVITAATNTTDANGNFSAIFTVPPSMVGAHTITATDGTNNVASIFTMEAEAPPIPTVLALNVVATMDLEEYLDWANVDDLSGVTYTLQVASDADFTTIVLEKKGLMNSEYPITLKDRLKSTGEENPYYWRVKSTDGASNESDWTQPGQLYIDFYQTSRPVPVTRLWGAGMWILLIAIGVGLAGLALIFIGFRR